MHTHLKKVMEIISQPVKKKSRMSEKDPERNFTNEKYNH